MAKKHGQAAMEYITVIGLMMLIFMAVLLVLYDKSLQISDTKTFLDAKQVVNTVITNINTISVQGDGYYKYFTIPEKLYSGVDYNITLYKNSVELKWSISSNTWLESTLNANINGSVQKGLNKVINCDGIVYIGNSSISCEQL